MNANFSCVLNLDYIIKVNAIYEQIYGYLVSSESNSIHSGIERNEISTNIQVLLLYKSPDINKINNLLYMET